MTRQQIWQIRTADAGDVPLIRAIVETAYGKWLPVLGYPPLPLLADYDDAIGRHAFDLLTVGGEIAALIETVPDGDALLIVNVAVAPGWQKRGYGRALLAHAEQRARELGLTRTTLYTNALMRENIALYSAMSYSIDREETVDGKTRVYMSKDLPVTFPA